MEERQVTVDGLLHRLPGNLFVIATQNPVEYEGTFPLPEAQTDRFLVKVSIPYPEREDEKGVLLAHHRGFLVDNLETSGASPVLDPEDLAAVRDAARAIRIEEPVLDYLLGIVAATRQSPHLSLGASPRASIALMNCGKVLAALRGREFVTPDEIKELCPPVLRHRLVLKPEAEIEGLTSDTIVEQVLAGVEVPR
jgi:MoxR-like ATPase